MRTLQRGPYWSPPKIQLFWAPIQKAPEQVLHLRRQLSSSILRFVAHPLNFSVFAVTRHTFKRAFLPKKSKLNFWGFQISQEAKQFLEFIQNPKFSESFDCFQFRGLQPKIRAIELPLFKQKSPNQFLSQFLLKQGSLDQSYLGLETSKLQSVKRF